MISIGTPSGMLKDAYGTKIEAWIPPQTSFQCLSFKEKFQFAKACLGAAYDVLGLGFDLVIILEWNWLAN